MGVFKYSEFDTSLPIIMVSFLQSVKFYTVGQKENKLIKTLTFDNEIYGIDANSTTFIIVIKLIKHEIDIQRLFYGIFF